MTRKEEKKSVDKWDRFIWIIIMALMIVAIAGIIYLGFMTLKSVMNPSLNEDVISDSCAIGCIQSTKYYNVCPATNFSNALMECLVDCQTMAMEITRLK